MRVGHVRDMELYLWYEMGSGWLRTFYRGVQVDDCSELMRHE